MKTPGRLIFFCGKMGAGKSTKAKSVASEENAVLLSEDTMLSMLYPGQIHTFQDYLEYSSRLRPFIKQHVQNILSTGTKVVLDFPANTKRQRSWFVSLCEEVEAEHQLFFLNLSDEECLRHIQKRRVEQPERQAFDTEEVFHYVTKFFEPPQEEERLNLLVLSGE